MSRQRDALRADVRRAVRVRNAENVMRKPDLTRAKTEEPEVITPPPVADPPPPPEEPVLEETPPIEEKRVHNPPPVIDNPPPDESIIGTEKARSPLNWLLRK